VKPPEFTEIQLPGDIDTNSAGQQTKWSWRMAATLLGCIINSKLGQEGSFPPMQTGLNV